MARVDISECLYNYITRDPKTFKSHRLSYFSVTDGEIHNHPVQWLKDWVRPGVCRKRWLDVFKESVVIYERTKNVDAKRHIETNIINLYSKIEKYKQDYTPKQRNKIDRLALSVGLLYKQSAVNSNDPSRLKTEAEQIWEEIDIHFLGETRAPFPSYQILSGLPEDELMAKSALDLFTAIIQRKNISFKKGALEELREKLVVGYVEKICKVVGETDLNTKNRLIIEFRQLSDRGKERWKNLFANFSFLKARGIDIRNRKAVQQFLQTERFAYRLEDVLCGKERLR